MNLLEWLLLALLCGPVAFWFYTLGMSVKRTVYARKTKACTMCPPFVDAERDESRINAFFYRIASERGLDLCTHGMLWKQASKSRDFILVCHALGYELVIRKVSDTDIEE